MLKPTIPLSPPPTPHSPPQEKLKYFPVCVNTKLEPEDEAEEGLGGLPSNISSVSSLLLFNTTENLYGQKAGLWRGGWEAWPGLVGEPGSIRIRYSRILQPGEPGADRLVCLVRPGSPHNKLIVPPGGGKGGSGPWP